LILRAPNSRRDSLISDASRLIAIESPSNSPHKRHRSGPLDEKLFKSGHRDPLSLVDSYDLVNAGFGLYPKWAVNNGRFAC
jgi:hypothetical protein